MNDAEKANTTPIDHIEMFPAACAILLSWPSASKIGAVKMYIGRRKIEVMNKTIHDL